MSSWENLRQYQNDAVETFSEYGKQLAENRWSDNFSNIRDEVSQATSEYTSSIMKAQTDITTANISKTFTQAQSILDTILQYYYERKNAGANADELKTIMEAYSTQSDTVEELSDQYVSAINSYTEYMSTVAERNMQGFSDQITWQDKINKGIEKQLKTTEDINEKEQLGQEIVDGEINKISIYKSQMDAAHQAVLKLREDEAYAPILEQFDIETWFDAEGNKSAQFSNDLERMAITTPELVPVMNQLFELVQGYKQTWYEADENIQNITDSITEQVDTIYEAQKALIQENIDNSEWVLSMLGDDSYELRIQETNKQINNHLGMITEIRKQQAEINKLYKAGIITYDDYVEKSREYISSLQDQYSSIKSLFEDIRQEELDKINDKIDDIKEASEKVTDEIQEQINELEEEKDALEELQNKWEQAISAAKQYLEDQRKALEENKDIAQDYWDDQIDAIKKANTETETNVKAPMKCFTLTLLWY